MDKNTAAITKLRIEKTMAALEKNNIKAYYAAKKSDVHALVQKMLPDGAVVASGGSMSLSELGILDLLRSGQYRYLDRAVPGLKPEDITEIYRKSFSADVYLCSSNAITVNGELYNVDGNSNRVAAMLYGPASVIVVAGYNKIVRDIDEAILRVKETAAPANAERLSCNTYCTQKGECISLSALSCGMTGGCASEERICSNYVVMAHQRQKYRVKVILVGEEVGY